ncbi:HEPN domain-containing protein [Rhodococcus sovatensis]|uniref:HEPN domain-containing protein n=1 Tax=Rhodococcus sovatensis TaxID=1805840 RepID=A0ABZ2PKB5_9NOCA
MPHNDRNSARFEGYWWLPRTPEDRIPGYLTISSEGKASLRLLGGFVSQHAATDGGEASKASGDDAFGAIYGITVDGEVITLVDPICTHTNSHLFDEKVRSQSYEPARVLVGLHLEHAHEKVFTSATFMLENFHAWAGLWEVSYTLNVGDNSYRTATVHQKPVTTVPISDGMRLVVTNRLGLFSTDLTTSAAETACTTATYMTVESDEPLRHNGFDEAINAVADLVTFATGEPSAITEYTITHQTPERRRRPILDDERRIRTEEYDRTVVATVRAPWSTTSRAPGTPTKETHKYLFTGTDVAIDDCITRWFELRTTARRGIDMLLSLTYGDRTFLQTEVLILAAAAEALHRSIAPVTLRMLPADFARIMTTAMKNLEPDEKQILQNAIHNEPTYRERLIDLAAIPSAPAVDALVPDVENWARDLTRIRNGLAHSMASYLAKPEDLDQMFALRQQTQLLLQLVVMAELQLSEDRQNEVVRRAGHYIAPAV